MVTGNDLQVKVVKLPPPTARPISKTQEVADAHKSRIALLLIQFPMYVIPAINQTFSE